MSLNLNRITIYLRKILLTSLILCINFTFYNCVPATGYKHKTVKPKNRKKPYNHNKDRNKKKTRTYWMKNL
jgi:hypothetical protein